MGKVRNIFAIDVGRYVKRASERRVTFGAACAIWAEAAQLDSLRLNSAKKGHIPSYLS